MISKYPEWKQLYDHYADKVEYDQILTYEELHEVSKLDMRGTRGRQQFYRFAQEMLAKQQVHFKAIATVGYRAVLPSEHLDEGINRLGRAKRRLIHGIKILAGTRYEMLNAQQQTANHEGLARMGKQAMLLMDEHRALTKVSGRSERPPSPMLNAATDPQV